MRDKSGVVGFWDKGNKGTIEAGREGPSPKKVLNSKDEIYFEFLEKKKKGLCHQDQGTYWDAWT